MGCDFLCLLSFTVRWNQEDLVAFGHMGTFLIPRHTSIPTSLSLFSVFLNTSQPETSLVVQWLKLCASNSRGTGVFAELKIPRATWHGQKKGGRTLEYILQVCCEGKGEESHGSLAHA